MNIRGTFILVAALATTNLVAAGAPPLAGEWNILPSGNAASSGDLLFRVTPNDGSDPVEIEVPVHAGASDRTVAVNIRQALGSQLPRNRYRVVQGEGANILVSDPRGRPNFSLELVTSDVDNLRVAVQSVTPAASPTVPRQAEPVPAPAITPPPPANAPGDVMAPPDSRAPIPNPTITPPAPEDPPGDAIPPPDTRAPRTPPDDMPSPREDPPVPGPDEIPLPEPTPRPAPTIPTPPRDAA